MNGIAVLAAKEAAVASGFGAGLLAPSAVDGFAAGTLLSGLCVLIVMGPARRMRRQRLPSRDVTWPTAAYAAAPPAYSAATYSAATISDPYADESAEALVPSGTPVPPVSSASPVPSARDEAGHVPESRGGGYRSKHRMSGPDAGDQRPESRRSAPRHAAPSHGIGTRRASRLAVHPLTVRD